MLVSSLFRRLCRPLRSEPVVFLASWGLLLQNTVCHFRWLLWPSAIALVCVAAFYAYVVSAVVSALRARWLKLVVYALLLLLLIVNAFLVVHFRSCISPNTLMLLFETTPGESAEFLTTYLPRLSSLAVVAGVGLVALLLWFVEHWWQRRRTAAGTPFMLSAGWGASLAVFPALGLLAMLWLYASLFSCRSPEDVEDWTRSHHAEGADDVTTLICSLVSLYLSDQAVQRAVQRIASLEPTEAHSAFSDDSLHVVLVIGESLNKHHCSVYGYPLATTPWLTAQRDAGRLWVFRDVVTPFNLTSHVLKNMLSTSSLGLGERWHDGSFLPAVVCRAGYEVYFWDNQYSAGRGQSFDFALNSFLHHPDVASACYTSTNKRSYEFDGDLVADWSRCAKTGRLRFSIVHLMGQHVAFYCRYPHGGPFDHFSADSIIAGPRRPWLTEYHRQVIADYDNAVRYNDSVLSDIAQAVSAEPSVVLFVSDHGEEVFDERPLQGRQFLSVVSDDVRRAEYEVPMVLWVSPRVQLSDSLRSALDRAVARPLSTDNLSPFIIGTLCGIALPDSLRRRDVASPDYVCPPIHGFSATKIAKPL